DKEEIWIGEGVKMLPPPVAHSGGTAWGSRRGRCGCLVWGAVLVLWNLSIVLASTVLLALVFSVVLLPAMLLLYAGFLCHSRVSCPQQCRANSTHPTLLFIHVQGWCLLLFSLAADALIAFELHKSGYKVALAS
uniref:Uncharacterized protein n=1 Tax=Sphaeramia orbicularis TaxID=375764 RepID=A0A673C1P0_9TELE